MMGKRENGRIRVHSGRINGPPNKRRRPMDVIFRREGPAVDEYWFPGNGNYWLSSDWPHCLIWSAYATRESVEKRQMFNHQFQTENCP